MFHFIKETFNIGIYYVVKYAQAIGLKTSAGCGFWP